MLLLHLHNCGRAVFDAPTIAAVAAGRRLSSHRAVDLYWHRPQKAAKECAPEASMAGRRLRHGMRCGAESGGIV
jgi:hypothetical protein